MLRVRGGATGVELAAVTAVLAAGTACRAGADPEADPYLRWRRGRVAALARKPVRTPQ